MTHRQMHLLALAMAAAIFSAPTWAQSDETNDASDIGTPATSDPNSAPTDNDNYDDEASPDEDSTLDTAAPDTDSAAGPANTGGDTTEADKPAEPPSRSLPKASQSDYGADDFQAPDDQTVDRAAAQPGQVRESLQDRTNEPTDNRMTNDPAAPAADPANSDDDIPQPDNYAHP